MIGFVVLVCFFYYASYNLVAIGKAVVTIIDAKASPKVKLSHRVQVAMYSLYLDFVFQREGLIGDVVISSTGGVWLRCAILDAVDALLLALIDTFV